jgi:hypothetical protein
MIELARKADFPYQLVAPALNKRPQNGEKAASRLADGQRKFADQVYIDQAATLPECVQGFGIVDTYSLLHYERIILVMSPLFVERCDAAAAAIGNHITNPLRI